MQRFTHSHTRQQYAHDSFIDQKKPCFLKLPNKLLDMLSRKSPIGDATIVIGETAIDKHFGHSWGVSFILQKGKVKTQIARASFSQGPWGTMSAGHYPNLDHLEVRKEFRRRGSA